MAKNKGFEIQKWMWIGGIPLLFGAILITARTIVAYADVPKRMDIIEKYIFEQQKANEIQAKANELLQQQIQQQPQKYQQESDQPYCEVSEGVLWCWDEDKEQWYERKP